MTNRVFLTDYIFALPDYPGKFDIAKLMDDQMSQLTDNTESPVFRKLNFSDDQLALINKQDLKTMREDALAAGICSYLLMNQLSLTPQELESLPLFVASGIVIEKLFARKPKVLKYFNDALLMKSKEDKNKRLSRILPPLLALETLTNAAETYAAQYGGIAGENTTFGGCSHGGFYALKEGFDQINFGITERAVVGAVNLSGINSYRTFSPFFKYQGCWRESQCAVFLILESENSLKDRGETPMVELSNLKPILSIPSLYEYQKNTFNDSIINTLTSSSLVFSGAFTDDVYRQDEKLCTTSALQSFCWYPSYGNLGSASVLMNLLAGSHVLKSGKAEDCDCIDRDPYGRISKFSLKLHKS